jgi:amino acid transporter
VLFALARDGLLPRALGRVHSRTSAPHVAILCYAALVVALALTGTFSELAVLSTLAVAPLYVAGCAAAWHLARRGVARAGPPLALRGLGAAAVTGIVSMVALIALASRAEILGLFGVIGASALAYGLRRFVGSR